MITAILVPNILSFNSEVVSSYSQNWGLFSIPLVCGGVFLAFNLSENKINPIAIASIAVWQIIFGCIAFYAFWSRMGGYDDAIAYWSFEYRSGFGNAALTNIQQAQNAELPTTIVYLIVTYLILTAPFPIINWLKNKPTFLVLFENEHNFL